MFDFGSAIQLTGQFGERIARAEDIFISLSFCQSEKQVTNCAMPVCPQRRRLEEFAMAGGLAMAVTGDRPLAGRARTRECSPSIQAWIPLRVSTGLLRGGGLPKPAAVLAGTTASDPAVEDSRWSFHRKFRKRQDIRITKSS